MLQNPPIYDAQILAELNVQSLVDYHTAVPDALFRSYLGSLSAVYSVAELAELTALDVRNLSLTDMSGVEYAASMTSLVAYGNELTELPIAALINLETLNIRDNQITAIYIASLTNLSEVSAYRNQLTELDVSDLVNLETLHIYDNLIEQSELETIIDDLWANRVALGANSCSIKLEDNPGSTATAVSKASEIADLITEGCSVTI